MSSVTFPLIAEGAHVASALVGLQADLATRTDSGATGSNSNNTITDSAIVATDLGRPVTGTNIPQGSYVGTVTAATSFLLVDASGATATPTGAVSGITLGGGYSLTALENWVPQVQTCWHKMFRTVKYALSVVGTTGTAPSSWSLGARFEQIVDHTIGYQFQFPIWSPLQPEQITAYIREGINWYGPGGNEPVINQNNYAVVGSVGADSFGTVASSTMVADDGSGTLPSGLVIPDVGAQAAAKNTARITVSRTISQEIGQTRVRFEPTISGGDSTTLIVLSALATGVY